MLSEASGAPCLLSKGKAQRGWLRILRVPVKPCSGDAGIYHGPCLYAYRLVMGRLLALIASGIDGRRGCCPLNHNIPFFVVP